MERFLILSDVGMPEKVCIAYSRPKLPGPVGCHSISRKPRQGCLYCTATAKTKRDPQYMRVSKPSTKGIRNKRYLSQGYCGSVTAQELLKKPVDSVSVKAPTELTFSANITVLKESRTNSNDPL
jgi:hypothetical protein